MDSQLTVPVIYGSVRKDRQGIKFALFVCGQLRERGIDAVLVDPMERQFPLLDKMYKEFPPEEAPAVMTDMATLLKKADGFVVVSGEYNNGIPPALKNMMDHFLEEYFWRPAGIACYSGGRWGGVRGAMQLRMTLAEMGMVTIPSLLPMARVGEAFTDDGTPTDKNTVSFSKQFFDEFVVRRSLVRRTPQRRAVLSESVSNAAFVAAVRLEDVLPEAPPIVRVGDYEVAIFLVDGEVYAYENACPHQGGPIGEGLIEGPTVTCPWHAWTFDLCSGEMAIGPGFARLRRFESRVRDGWVEVATQPEPA